jgi:thiol-disulfide isomerase/thioredoxin
VHLNLGRRTALAGAATLLAALSPRNSARADSADLHPPVPVTVNPPTPLPDLPLLTLAGATTTLKAYLGKPLVLNFWATWCIPCVSELPELDALAAGGTITVIAVSADRTGLAAVGPFLAKHDLSHATILLDHDSDVVHAAGVFGFPTTLIVDPSGHVRARLEGPAAWSTAAPIVTKLTS